MEAGDKVFRHGYPPLAEGGRRRRSTRSIFPAGRYRLVGGERANDPASMAALFDHTISFAMRRETTSNSNESTRFRYRLLDDKSIDGLTSLDHVDGWPIRHAYCSKVRPTDRGLFGRREDSCWRGDPAADLAVRRHTTGSFMDHVRRCARPRRRGS